MALIMCSVPGVIRARVKCRMPSLISLVLSLWLSPAGAAPQAAGIEGDWIGALAAGGANLRLAFHVTRDAAGRLGGTMDSLDQGAVGLKIETVSVTGVTVRFELKVPPAAFQGTLSANGSQIQGAWLQGGASLPLVLSRGRADAPKRPQVPARPYPYKDEDVSYQNKSAGITLAGTLTLPRATTPAPAVILITGSGAEDRDETVFGHKPFLVLADRLTRNGIAVLRVDDRGVGGSSGNVDDATSEDFAGDVLAGIDYLKTRREIDPKRIGLIGHSEGGLIAPMAAVRSPEVAFIVLMAGPGLPGDELLYLQGSALAKAAGASDAAIAGNRAAQERIFTIVKTEKDPAAAGAKLARVRQDLVAAVPDSQKASLDAMLQAQIKQVSTPWFRYFLSYDPRPVLSKVKCPVLAIDGELDLQVPFGPNLEAIGAALKAGGNVHVTLVHPPGLNHLFQTATTGSPAEYSRIEETIAPAALDTITEWIRKTAGGF
jgi:pimeloyl-ACP methyl ester carboxylesterase